MPGWRVHLIITRFDGPADEERLSNLAMWLDQEIDDLLPEGADAGRAESGTSEIRFVVRSELPAEQLEEVCVGVDRCFDRILRDLHHETTHRHASSDAFLFEQ